MSDDDNDALNSTVAVLLNGVGAAAIVATIYHCLVMTWCCRYRARPHPQEPQLYVNCRNACTLTVLPCGMHRYVALLTLQLSHVSHRCHAFSASFLECKGFRF
ncbi:RING-H2 finger protein ATL57-like [Populus alba x Populus x berolinensis]|nr:RING-H2 finger protein ATL57-like [Populus alba x Populus x berolinensis]